MSTTCPTNPSWNFHQKTSKRKSKDTDLDRVYLDAHGLLVGLKLAPCTAETRRSMIGAPSQSNRTKRTHIISKNRKGHGVGRGGAPLAALFFSELRSRAILDFWPLPPPMVDGSGDDRWQLRAPRPASPGGRPATLRVRFVVHGRRGGWQISLMDLWPTRRRPTGVFHWIGKAVPERHSWGDLRRPSSREELLPDGGCHVLMYSTGPRGDGSPRHLGKASFSHKILFQDLCTK